MMLGVALAVLASLQAPAAEETVSYGYVIVRVPAGWKCDRKAEGLFLRPGDLKEDEAFVVIIPPGGKSEGNLAEAFEKSWKQAAGEKKIVKKAPGREMKTDGGTDGLMSVGLLETADGFRLITAVAVFKPGDRGEAVVALTDQDGLFQRYSGPFGALLKGLRFKNIELPSYDLLLSMGYSDTAGKTTTRILFKDGTWLEGLPGGGMDDLDAAAAKSRFGASCGTHETQDGALTLRRGSTIDSLKKQTDGCFRSKDNVQFVRIPTSTGLRLEGRYHLHGGQGKPGTECIVLKADGTFEDLGAGAAFLPPAEVPAKFPTAGGYEILNNTMFLMSADSRIRRISFLVMPKAGEANPEFVLINGRWFKRE